MEDYRKHGKWVGNETLDGNCSIPEALFESTVTKPEDLFGYIRYCFFDGSNDTKEYATSLSSKIWSHVDTDYYGRCFTFKPTKEMIKLGINRIYLSLKKSSFVFFHTNGMFDTKTYGRISQLFVPLFKKFNLDLDFTVYSMLDIGGKPCKTEPGFDQDLCIESQLDKKLLTKVALIYFRTLRK